MFLLVRFAATAVAYMSHVVKSSAQEKRLFSHPPSITFEMASNCLASKSQEMAGSCWR